MCPYVQLTYVKVPTCPLRRLLYTMLGFLWGGPLQEGQVEPPSAEEALIQCIGWHGDFERNENGGTLKFDDFLAFRAITMRQTTRLFKPKKEEQGSLWHTTQTTLGDGLASAPTKWQMYP